MLLAHLGDGRSGIVGHQRARIAGIGAGALKHRLAAGSLHLVHDGVYAVGHADLCDEAWLHAAVEACGEDTTISHHSAVRRWRLLRELPLRPVHVTVPRDSGPRRRPGIVAHRPVHLDPRDVMTLGLLPIVTVPRALLDIAPHVEPRQLAIAVHRARVERRMTLDELRATMTRASTARGLRRLRAAAFGDDVPPNRRERRFRGLLREAGLPLPQTNVLVPTGDGRYLVDCLWPGHRLVYEIDDLASHGTAKALVDDRRRDNALLDAGFRVRRLTDQDLWPRAAATIARLSRQLGCDSV